MTAFSRVHALFSGVESFLRQGDLLPGPERHRWSKDQPAYEFPAGEAEVRVLARKLTGKPEWLIVAWAADGKERAVKAVIPDLGEVALNARACGSVYRVSLRDAKPVVAQLDVP
jgi:hypothetical protein